MKRRALLLKHRGKRLAVCLVAISLGLATFPLAALAAVGPVMHVQLEFEGERLDLDTGTLPPAAEEPGAATGADLYLAYNADRVPHAVVVPVEGAQIAFLAASPFDDVTLADAAGQVFTANLIDVPLGSGDTVLVRTGTGALFKLGNAVESSDQVALDYQSLEESTAALAPARPAGVLVAARRGAAKTPEALPDAEWRQIRGLLAARSYSVRGAAAAEGAFEAHNARHALRTFFGADGVRVSPLQAVPDQAAKWEWGMRLRGVGYGDAIAPAGPAELVAEGQRVEYRSGDLVEWYVNDARGLEQGFTLAAAPATRGEGPLAVELEVLGSLTARSSADGDAIFFHDASGERTLLRYGGLVAWDAEGRHLPVQMAAVDGRIRLEVDDAGATYPVVIDPIVTNEAAKLIASDSAALADFGISVAVDGDTAVVGASFDDPAGNSIITGLAYVFVRSDDGVWSALPTKLTASDAGNRDHFGISVAVSGDTAVVGAHQDDDAGSNSGSAYVFVRSGETWSEQAKLTAGDAFYNDLFGSSVAVSGDTVVVGAYGDDSYSGSAYVFVRSAGVWSEQAKLTAGIDATAHDRFGTSVAVSGDTAVVGARYDDHTATNLNEGSAYVFVRSSGVWSEQAKLTASDAATNDYFGFSVAVSGDTAVVGKCNSCGGSSTGSGSAYVFERNQGGVDNWGEQAKLTASDATAYDNFGISVAVSGDRAVVGANGLATYPKSGSAYVFVRSAGVWGEQTKLIASDTQARDEFGISVAVSGGTAVVGAHLDDVAGITDAGSAYVFDFAVCGDGILDPGFGEECDDGNASVGDGCRPDCSEEICGDAILDPQEECDDGNATDGDGCQANCALPFCGDGILDPGFGEECDDGNASVGDGCRPDCSEEICGDAILDPQEECDDGNAINGDGCQANCALPLCGDGILDLILGEGCDDGNLVEGDGCSGTCHIEECGNGIVDPNEECDDGNGALGDGCRPDCTQELCGDGVLDPQEQCDDANNDPGDGCSATCTDEICGDGILNPQEQCDDGNLIDGDGCQANCALPLCGDFVIDFGEQCDDGNVSAGDGCSAACQVEECGNGILDPGEDCDDANLENGDGCRADCSIEFCGDGVLDPQEQCDDGNVVSGDGCSAACEIEAPGGGEGCGQGYWKQEHHFDSWPGPYAGGTIAEGGTPFADVFEDAFPNYSLSQVLRQGGGGLKALGRHAVAALLNAASSEVSYDLTAPEVVEMFNQTHPGRKGAYNTLKDNLESYNQQGCPLN